SDEHLGATLMSFLTALSEKLTCSAQTMSVAEWQQLAAESLSNAARLTKQLRYPRRHEEFTAASRGLYIALLESLTTRECANVRETLQIAHEIAVEWHARNPSAGLRFDLPPPP